MCWLNWGLIVETPTDKTEWTAWSINNYSFPSINQRVNSHHLQKKFQSKMIIWHKYQSR